MLSWDSSTISGLYMFVLVCLVSGVSRSLRAGRLKMMSTKKRCEENHRPRIGKQRLIKCYEMLMKFESSFFKNPIFQGKKHLVTCVSLELSRSYRSKNRTQSLASSLRLCPVGYQDFLYIPPEKWCSGHRVWKGVMNRSSLLSSTQYINIFYINYTLTMINNLSLLTLYIFTLYNMYPVSLSHRLKSLCKLVLCKHVKLFNEMMVTETIF